MAWILPKLALLLSCAPPLFATEPVPSDKLLDAALRLTEQARYAEAEAAFGNALAEAERANDRGGQARVANEMAGLLCARGDLPHAE